MPDRGQRSEDRGQKSEHTPGPWAVNDDLAIRTDHDELIYGPPGRAVDAAFFSDVPGRAEANAAFIVRACNAHDDLVKALRSFVGPWSMGGGDWQAKITYDTYYKARAALAKAEAKGDHA